MGFGFKSVGLGLNLSVSGSKPVSFYVGSVRFLRLVSMYKPKPNFRFLTFRTQNQRFWFSFGLSGFFGFSVSWFGFAQPLVVRIDNCCKLRLKKDVLDATVTTTI